MAMFSPEAGDLGKISKFLYENCANAETEKNTQQNESRSWGRMVLVVLGVGKITNFLVKHVGYSKCFAKDL